jgi:hypothetical protein
LRVDPDPQESSAEVEVKESPEINTALLNDSDSGAVEPDSSGATSPATLRANKQTFIVFRKVGQPVASAELMKTFPFIDKYGTVAFSVPAKDFPGSISVGGRYTFTGSSNGETFICLGIYESAGALHQAHPSAGKQGDIITLSSASSATKWWAEAAN